MHIDHSGKKINFTARLTGVEGKPLSVEAAINDVIQAIRALDIQGTAGQVNATADAVILIGHCCRRDIGRIKEAIASAIPDTNLSFNENDVPQR